MFYLYNGTYLSYYVFLASDPRASGRRRLIEPGEGRPRTAGRESHRKSAKYEKRKSWTRRARLTAPQPWTLGRSAAPAPLVLYVTIIGNNANRPPPFYSQPEHFQGETAHSTSPHTNEPTNPHSVLRERINGEKTIYRKKST